MVFWCLRRNTFKTDIFVHIFCVLFFSLVIVKWKIFLNEMQSNTKHVKFIKTQHSSLLPPAQFSSSIRWNWLWSQFKNYLTILNEVIIRMLPTYLYFCPDVLKSRSRSRTSLSVSLERFYMLSLTVIKAVYCSCYYVELLRVITTSRQIPLPWPSFFLLL